MEPQLILLTSEEGSAAESTPTLLDQATASTGIPRPTVIRSTGSSAVTSSRGRPKETTLAHAGPFPSNDPPPSIDPPSPIVELGLPATPAKKRGRPCSKKQSDPKTNSVQVRESLLEVGSPVYAPFPGKNPSHEPYYWGTVTKKTLNRDRVYTYNIDFDDGDKLYNFSSQYLFRMEEILQEFIRGDLKVLLKPPKKYIPLWNSKRDGPAPTEYFQNDADHCCTQCWQCMFLRQRCGMCALCRKNKERASSSKRPKIPHCIQTMCIEVAKTHSQTYGIVPPTWYFYFDDPNDPRNSEYKGLWIMKENVVKKWRNFENARRSACIQFHGYSKRKFYQFIGLEYHVQDTTARHAGKNGGAVVGTPRSVVVDVDVKAPSRSKKTKVAGSPSTIIPLERTPTRPSFHKNSFPLSVLHSNRCRICWMCIREACQKCHACVINMGRTLRHPNVCFRKMCEQFQENEKKQMAPGFDQGWNFYFNPPPYATNEDHDLKGLTILSPTNERFTNVESALENCFGRSSDLEQARQQFCNYIGASLSVPLPNSVLLGKSFFKEWLRVDGSKVFLTGRVTQVREDTVQSKEVFTVTYDEESRERLNRSNHGKLHVPASWNFFHHDAWDGCLRSFELGGLAPERFQPIVPFCERWVTPNTYSRHMIPAQGTIFPGYCVLPCVEITYRGYLLKFSVKKSTILKARFGVFLSIRPLVSSTDLSTEFRLPAGTLLDFGVYAPFRIEDVRSDHDHFIKSMIHSYKNEMYCFNGRDSEFYLDITDDWTGDLHGIARRHVPPFVNEIQDPSREIPAVHARLDPEGALHYHLGHPELEQGDFCFMANGNDEEIFVDYGPEYEMVRLREKYPRVSLDEAESERRLLVETCEYADELNTFTAAEVDHFIKSYSPILSWNPPPTKKILIRIIAVTMLLKDRAATIHKEFLGLRDDESICDNGVRDLDMGLLLNKYDQMLQSACHLWENHYGSFQDMCREAKECDLFLVAFSKVWPQDSLDSLTLEAFFDRLYPSHHA